MSRQEWWKISITNACLLLTSFLSVDFLRLLLLLLLSYNIQERKLVGKHGASSWLGYERFRRTRKEEENRMNECYPRIRRLFFSLFFSFSLIFFFLFLLLYARLHPTNERICQFFLFFFFLLPFFLFLHLLRSREWRMQKKENWDAFFYFLPVVHT